MLINIHETVDLNLNLTIDNNQSDKRQETTLCIVHGGSLNPYQCTCNVHTR